MGKIMLLIGIFLLFAGIFAEAMYITTSRVAYSSVVWSDSYLVTGLLFIVVGFILMLSSVKMRKIQSPI